MASVHTRRRLIGIGCGPRNSAIGVHTHVLRQAGILDLDFRIMEADSVGSSWTGGSGYTNGDFPLDTEPLKDLTFPCTSLGAHPDELSSRFSFISFLKTRGQAFERWVSASTPPIPHSLFAEYQQWAIERAQVEVIKATVTRIQQAGDEINVSATDSGGRELAESASGIVISGPGEPKRVSYQDHDPERIFDSKTYWRNRMVLREMKDARVAVVGSGQSAGTIAQSLLAENPSVKVEIINRFGFLPALSTGLSENYMSSSAQDTWKEIPISDRKEILNRINHGVIASYVKQFLDAHPNLSVTQGRVERVVRDHGTIMVQTSSGRREHYDVVVVAVGFSPLETLERLMPGAADANWFQALRLDGAVDRHLRVPDLTCSIHIPAMAGLSQGPGLALLSCLATMAQRVVSAYQT